MLKLKGMGQMTKIIQFSKEFNVLHSKGDDPWTGRAQSPVSTPAGGSGASVSFKKNYDT